MAAKTSITYWRYRRVNAPGPVHRIILAGLVIAGIGTIVYFFDWWFRAEHVASVPFFLLLSLVFWWGIIRSVILWTAYLRMKVPDVRRATGRRLSVAIFTTSSPGEPLSMFEKTLEACKMIAYPHTTYLLDDTTDPRYREVAEAHGAVWMELIGYPGAKAGKINEALKRTNESFILVLDPDHIPFPNFLDEVLGHFDDENVGFVQVSQAYYNQYRSFVAGGAAEQTYGFYGPTQMGLNGCGAAVAIGANCTFRRTALESIGGHGTGLAEDLVTSIRLHAKGWKSVYVPSIISRGLVPEDFGSFCRQQLKWSRGVHEVLFAELPRAWRKLSGWQRLSYFTIGTYYLSGLIMFIFLLLPYLYLWFGVLPAHMDFTQFLLVWSPVAMMSLLIYIYVQQWLCHPGRESGLHLRGMFLKFACWYVFLLGFLLSVGRKNIPYTPTAKKAVPGVSGYVWPLIIHQLLFIVTVAFVLIKRIFFTAEASLSLTSANTWGMVAFATVSVLMSTGGTWAAIQSKRLKPTEPWNELPKASVAGRMKRIFVRNVQKETI